MYALQMKIGSGPAVCINQSTPGGLMSIQRTTFKKRNINKNIGLYWDDQSNCNPVLRVIMMEGLEKIHLRGKAVFGSGRSSGSGLEMVAFRSM